MEGKGDMLKTSQRFQMWRSCVMWKCVCVFMCIFACVYNVLSFRVLQLELHTDKLYRSCQNTTYKILIVCFSVATYFIYAEYFLCISSYLRVSPCSVYTELC